MWLRTETTRGREYIMDPPIDLCDKWSYVSLIITVYIHAHISAALLYRQYHESVHNTLSLTILWIILQYWTSGWSRLPALFSVWRLHSYTTTVVVDWLTQLIILLQGGGNFPRFIVHTRLGICVQPSKSFCSYCYFAFSILSYIYLQSGNLTTRTFEKFVSFSCSVNCR